MFFCVYFGACSSVYYSTQLDPQISFDPQEPLAIYIGSNPTIKDKKFGILLAETMVEQGFGILGFNVERQESRCFVTFSLDVSSSSYTGSYTSYQTRQSSTYIPSSSYTGYGFNPGRTVTTTTSIPITNVYTVSIVLQNIGIAVHCLMDESETPSMIWFGFLSADISIYEKYQLDIVKYLVGLIGKEFKGDVSLTKLRANKQTQ